MTFEMIFSIKLDFEIFYSAVITTEGLTLDASIALLRNKSFDEKSKVSQIEKRRGVVRLLLMKRNE